MIVHIRIASIIISFLWFVFFFIFLNLQKQPVVRNLHNGLPQIQVVVLWLPMLSHRQRVQRSANVQVLHKNLEVLYWKPAFFCWSKGNYFISLNRWWMDINGSGMAILLSYDTRDSYRSIPRRRMEWLHQPRFNESRFPGTQSIAGEVGG